MRKIMLLLIFLVAAFLLTSCGVPREVEEALTAKLQEDYSDNHEIKNIRIVQSERMQITDKDKANGIQERWCIKASFIWRWKNAEWWDDTLFSFEAYRKEDEWNYYYPVLWPPVSLDEAWLDGYMEDYYLECLDS